MRQRGELWEEREQERAARRASSLHSIIHSWCLALTLTYLVLPISREIPHHWTAPAPIFGQSRSQIDRAVR